MGFQSGGVGRFESFDDDIQKGGLSFHVVRKTLFGVGWSLYVDGSRPH